MTATKQNPQYTCYIVTQSKKIKYNITKAVSSVRLQEREGQIAQAVTIKLYNAEYGSTTISSLINVRDRVYVYANDGEKSDEVFRGFIWTINTNNSVKKKELSLTCYDNLIYFQESEENKYFASGKTSKSIASSLCKSWGVKLKYTYSSIKHGKMPLSGTLSNIFLSDILEKVRKKTGKKYVMRSDKDVVYIKTVGTNSPVYKLESKKNVTSESKEITMDGMITKVVIITTKGKDSRPKVKATVKGSISKYGTLQKIQSKSDEDSLSKAKKEAKETINENGKPKCTYDIEAVDIPWIHKGDKVYVNAGDLNGRSCIVLSAEHNINDNNKTMTLTVETV